MNTLVVYYSRTGNNKSIAEIIAKSISADLDEIIDKKDRSGVLGWLRAGKDSKSQNETEIEYSKNPQEYDTIVIGSPIWAGNIIPPLRTYLESVDLSGKRVAFFICCKTEGYNEILPQLKEMTPEAIHIATYGIQEKTFKEGTFEEELQDFISKIQ
ncbi:MAG: flavodoxin [Candidatus Lokiarchaeota archaeon]|nr:flavodoxin [Candidatus Lokiarchaeota archaeon]